MWYVVTGVVCFALGIAWRNYTVDSWWIVKLHWDQWRYRRNRAVRKPDLCYCRQGVECAWHKLS